MEDITCQTPPHRHRRGEQQLSSLSHQHSERLPMRSRWITGSSKLGSLLRPRRSLFTTHSPWRQFQHASSPTRIIACRRPRAEAWRQITVPTSVRAFSFAGGPRDDDNYDHDHEHRGDDKDDDLSYENFDDNDDDSSWDDKVGSRSFQRNVKRDDDAKGAGRRLYLDSRDRLEDRVKKFLNVRLGEMHPLDIVISSVNLIRECGKRRTFEGMKFAHDVLDRILEEKHYVNSQRTPDDRPPPYAIVVPERVFEVLMYGWSNISRKVSFAPQRMREVLDLMIQEAEYDEATRIERMQEGAPVPESGSVTGKKHSDVDPAEMFAHMSCQPTVGIYNTLLNGLAQASYRSIASANEAEDTLRVMERTARRRGWHTKPNTKSFMYVISAFARARHPSSGDRAEDVLRRMIRYHEQQLELYQEEKGVEYDPADPSYNERRVVIPDAIAYTAVIQAHSESGAADSCEKALALLTEMMQSSNPLLKPDAFAFSATINAFSKRAAKVKVPAKRLEAAEAAEEILWLMVDTLAESQSETTTDDNPHVVPFNTCLNAWANANLKESPTRAEAILQKMLDPAMSTKIGVRPNVVSFNTCMQVWARASRRDPEAPRRAEDLLHMMEQVDSLNADVNSYAILISAYAKSTLPDKVLQARRVLEALLSNLSIMPTRENISAVPFTAVLNAAASSVQDEHAGDESADNDPFGLREEEALLENDKNPYGIALKTYDEVSADAYELGIAPDHLMFASMVDVIAGYTSPDSIERRQRLEQVFHDACSAGEVSAMVVQALAKATPSTEMLKELLELRTWPVESVNALPREWIRKVPPAFKTLRFPGSRRTGEKGKMKPGKNYPSS